MLLLFHAVNNYVWLKRDTCPPYWDMAGHLLTSLRYLGILSGHNGNIVNAIRDFLNVSPYPPLFHVSAIPLYVLFGTSEDIAVMSNILFLGILIFSTYGIGKHLHEAHTGLLSAFSVSMYPIVFGLSRHYLIDVALMAMVSLAIYFLLLSDRFRSRGYSLALGIVLGLGMLTKSAFFFFVVGPFLLVAFEAFFASPKRHFLNVLLSLGAGGTLLTPWYLSNLRKLMDYFIIGVVKEGGVAEGDPSIATLKSVLYYLFMLVDHQIFLFFFILFIIGCIWAVLKFRSQNKLLLLWVGVSYLILAFFTNKDIRFTMPFLPAVAMISTFWIFKTSGKITRIVTVALIVLVAAFQFAMVSYGVDSIPAIGVIPSEVKFNSPIYAIRIYGESVHIASPPKAEDWKTQQILDDIFGNAKEEHRSSEDKQIFVGIVPNCVHFESAGFTYYVLLAELPIRVVSVMGDPDYGEVLLQCDYVVTKTGSQGPAWTTKYIFEAMAALEDPLNPLYPRFQVVKQYKLPDGSMAQLYKRTHVMTARD